MNGTRDRVFPNRCNLKFKYCRCAESGVYRLHCASAHVNYGTDWFRARQSTSCLRLTRVGVWGALETRREGAMCLFFWLVRLSPWNGSWPLLRPCSSLQTGPAWKEVVDPFGWKNTFLIGLARSSPSAGVSLAPSDQASNLMMLRNVIPVRDYKNTGKARPPSWAVSTSFFLCLCLLLVLANPPLPRRSGHPSCRCGPLLSCLFVCLSWSVLLAVLLSRSIASVTVPTASR